MIFSLKTPQKGIISISFPEIIYIDEMDGISMTVVFSSIAEEEKSIIMVADKMLTMSDLTYQFEHYGTKISQKGNFLIGYAGTTVFANDIISYPYDYEKPIREFVEDFSKYFIKYRLAIINRILLESLGLNLTVFNSNPQNFPVQLQQAVYNELQEFDLGVEFIICGFDDGYPKLYLVGKKGVYTAMHSIGYSAIGIGERHVTNFYIVKQFNINMPLLEALYFAYQAKKSSEIASGVGRNTDICILKDTAACSFFSNKDKLLIDLDSIYTIHNQNQEKLYAETMLPKIRELTLEVPK